jgi:hypothetical protein
MRENATEIKKVLDEHQCTINAIIFDVMGTFKLPGILRKAAFAKHAEYGVPEILALLIVLPLLLLNSVNSLYHSEFQAITTMKKDALYRLKNQERMPWRTILYGVAKRFQPQPVSSR